MISNSGSSRWSSLTGVAALLLAPLGLAAGSAEPASAQSRIKVLLVTGQSHRYHNWEVSSPIVARQLEDSGRFAVTVATTPAKGTAPNQDMSSFAPRFSDYQIMKGLPPAWMHAKDELYSNLRGPARNVTVLATATAPTSMPNGTGENEPIVMAIAYGNGRIFHDTLGHVGATQKEPIVPTNSVDYIVLLQRGTEWAATGAVTIPVPRDFPTADKTSIR
jgi:hypothetical protein